MQFPITIGLHRSYFLDGAVMIVALLASGATLFFPQAFAVRLLILIAVWLVAGLCWWQLSPTLTAIRLISGGQILLASKETPEFIHANLLPVATVHPWLTVLQLKTETGARHTLIAAVDSLERQDFRRLRVFLRWRKAASAINDDA